MTALASVVGKLPVDGEDQADRRRRLVAELCKVIGSQLEGGNGDANGKARAGAAAGIHLSRRVRQTLEGLLRGDQEKQIASAMGVSPHTVHVYVKQLYRRFDVSSRGELLARFVRGN
jgi:DNA-binding NarL/FixJ family response regulator